MAWRTICKATEWHTNRLNAAAERFCNRHNIEYGENEYGYTYAVDAVSDATSVYRGQSESSREQAQYLRKLWRPVMRRALDEPTADGIAYGTVGYHID